MGRARYLKLLPTQGRLPARYLYNRLFRTYGQEIKLLRDVARHDALAVDVGAAVGLYSYGFTRFSRKVVAFEPNPQSAAAIRAHRHAKIEVHECALSAEKGQGKLYIPQDAQGEHPASAAVSQRQAGAREIPIRIETLDSFELQDLALLKIDVEGHESDVLRGAHQTIKRERPVMLIEIEQRHLSRPIETVFEEILALGYEGSFLEKGARTPLSRFDLEKHQRVEQGVMSLEYVNDFLFVPSR